MTKTVVVTLTDKNYFERAKRTIIDARTRGNWKGDLVLITIGFNPSQNFIDYYEIIHKRFEHIPTDILLAEYNKFPLKIEDNRHILKLTQWDKFYVFDPWFIQWDKVIFFDAGLRIFDSISNLDNIPCDGKILAPDDAPPNNLDKRFYRMFDLLANPVVTNQLLKEYGKEILNERYFLNCIWVYDTKLLHKCNINHLTEAMYKFPICTTNEMTIMNLLFTMKLKVWEPFPEYIINDNSKKQVLFGWTEYDRYSGKTWKDFCFIKYPQGINFNCD